MADTLVKFPITYYPDPTQGRPVFNGSVYFGEPGEDPEIQINRKTITLLQEDGSQVPIPPASQPLTTTAGGVIVYDGGYPSVYADGDLSIKVLNSSGSQVYYVPSIPSDEAGQLTSVDDWVRYAITAGGLNPDGGDETQLAISMSQTAAQGLYYIDSGVADAYDISPPDDFEGIHAYGEGIQLIFNALVPNTGAATVDVNGVGPIPIKLDGGGTPAAGDISGRVTLEIRPDSPWTAFIVPAETKSALPGYIDGFSVAPNSSAPTTDLDIAPGACSDSTSVRTLVSESTVVKELDSGWAEGTNAGGTANGAALTDYGYVFVIGKLDSTDSDFVVDDNKAGTNVFLDANINSAGYTLKRYSIAIPLNGSGLITDFTNDGDDITLAVPNEDYAGAMSLTEVLEPVIAPPGYVVNLAAYSALTSSTATHTFGLVSSPDVADTLPSVTAYNLFVYDSASVQTIDTGMALAVRTDSSSQVRWRFNQVGTASNFRLVTLGWTDDRGRGDADSYAGFSGQSAVVLPSASRSGTVYYSDFSSYINDDQITNSSGQAAASTARINMKRVGNIATISGRVFLTGYSSTNIPSTDNAFVEVDFDSIISGKNWFSGYATDQNINVRLFGLVQVLGSSEGYGVGCSSSILVGGDLFLQSIGTRTPDDATVAVTQIEHAFSFDIVVTD